MKLVVGLGNPGRKYEGTRHNVGFRVLTEVSARHQAGKPRKAFQGECVDVDVEGERTLLLWPHTFMNLSGASVLEARDFYKLDNQQLLIVCDDFNLPLGQLRFRPSGSAGGQKGLDDVIRRLSTDQIQRLRIGVGPIAPGYDAVEFVLGRFNKVELSEIEHTVIQAADATELWIRAGIATCMNQYN